MLASHLQPITDVAKPVIERPASSAHSGVAAVITHARAPHRERLGEGVDDLGAVQLHRDRLRGDGARGLEQPRLAHGIARELHAVAVLEQLLERRLDARVVLGADPQQIGPRPVSRSSPSSTTACPSLIT